MESIEKKVGAVLRKVSGAENVETSRALVDDLGLSSLKMVDLLLGLEDALGITLKQSDMNFFKLKTVGDLSGMARYTAGGFCP